MLSQKSFNFPKTNNQKFRFYFLTNYNLYYPLATSSNFKQLQLEDCKLQLKSTSSWCDENFLTWKLFHFHWVEILSCLKRFLYILLCFCPSCRNLLNPILPLITELIIWIHHETLRSFTESTKTSYWAHHSGSCGFKTQIEFRHIWIPCMLLRKWFQIKNSRKCNRMRAFISCCLSKFRWFINSLEHENQKADMPFHQTVDSSVVSMKSALGRDRTFVSEFF